jgi:hypothetical protein
VPHRPGENRQSQQRADDAELEPPLQNGVVRMKRHDRAVDVAQKKIRRQVQIVSDVHRAVGQGARRIHAPAEERMLRHAVAGEAPNDQTMERRAPEPRRGLAQPDDKVARRVDQRQRHGQGGKTGNERSGDDARPPPGRREDDGGNQEPEQGAEAEEQGQGEQSDDEDEGGGDQPASQDQVADRDPAGDGQNDGAAVER